MRRLALALLLLTAPASAFAGTAIPPQFRGLWGGQRNCGTDIDEDRLVVSAGEIEFYYSAGPVKSVRVDDDTHISVVATLSTIRHIDIDITFDDRNELVLSKSGTELTLVRDGGEIVKRQRCPQP